MAAHRRRAIRRRRGNRADYAGGHLRRCGVEPVVLADKDTGCAGLHDARGAIRHQGDAGRTGGSRIADRGAQADALRVPDGSAGLGIIRTCFVHDKVVVVTTGMHPASRFSYSTTFQLAQTTK